MLTDIEKNRLTNRDNLDTKIRARNEFIVRNKLKSWLEDSGDALFVIKNLDDKQLRKIIVDEMDFNLFDITEQITSILNFELILSDQTGAFVCRYVPSALSPKHLYCDPNLPAYYEFQPIREATETDLKRAELFKNHIYNLFKTLHHHRQIGPILKEVISENMGPNAVKGFIKEMFNDLLTLKNKVGLLEELQKELSHK